MCTKPSLYHHQQERCICSPSVTESSVSICQNVIAELGGYILLGLDWSMGRTRRWTTNTKKPVHLFQLIFILMRSSRHSTHRPTTVIQAMDRQDALYIRLRVNNFYKLQHINDRSNVRVVLKTAYDKNLTIFYNSVLENSFSSKIGFKLFVVQPDYSTSLLGT